MVTGKYSTRKVLNPEIIHEKDMQREPGPRDSQSVSQSVIQSVSQSF